MDEELKQVKSNFVSIDIEDYNVLLKTSDVGTTCINNESEVDLEVDDLKSLIVRCLKFYEKIYN